MPGQPSNIFRIELTSEDGQLYHSSLVSSDRIVHTHSIVSKDPSGTSRHFAFTRLTTEPYRTTLHFHEVNAPTELGELLKGFREATSID